MNISNEGVAITHRFFLALDSIISMKRIRGVQTFTREFGIDRRNFMLVKSQPSQSILKPEWIAYLCNNYGISATWIISGRGNMLE